MSDAFRIVLSWVGAFVVLACVVPDYNKTELHMIRGAISAVDYAPTVGGWISVKDKLPGEKEDVLLLFPMNMAVGFLIGSEWFVNSGCDWCTPVIEHVGDIPPTHWMPLPEPPKEDNDAE